MSKETEAQPSTMETFKIHEKDSGSSAVQIALLTHRIESLGKHFKTHAKDFSGRRGLMGLVSQRRTLLAYLKKTNKESYESLLNKLNLRH